MDIMGKMKAQQAEKTEAIKEAKEAAEAKAAEYAALAEKVDRLEMTITELTAALQEITPAKIEQFQQEGVKVFEPLKHTADEVANKIQEAGKDAIISVKKAGNAGINWKGRIVSAFLIACFFCVIQFFIQLHFAPNIDYAKRLMWNFQMCNDNPDLIVDFFDEELEVRKKMENEQKYRAGEKLKSLEKAMHNP